MDRNQTSHKSKIRKNNLSLRNVIFVLGAVVLAIGGGFYWNNLQDSSNTKIQRLDTIGIQVGEIAPDFNVQTLEGETISLSSRRGEPTIVFFMAYWCGTCIPEAVALNQLKEEMGNDVNIIVIDVDPSSTPDALTQFKQASGNGEYTWAFDANQEIVNLYQVRSLDTTVILDGDGYIVYRDEYPTNYSTFKNTFSELL